MEEVTAREKVMKKFRAIALLALTVRSLIAEELKMLYSMSRLIYIFVYIYDIYIPIVHWCRKLSEGRNCPVNEIITMEEGCKQAAEALGMTYEGSIGSASYPAGCFAIQQQAFYNPIVDTSSTYLETYRLGAGVCLYRGI